MATTALERQKIIRDLGFTGTFEAGNADRFLVENNLQQVAANRINAANAPEQAQTPNIVASPDPTIQEVTADQVLNPQAPQGGQFSPIPAVVTQEELAQGVTPLDTTSTNVTLPAPIDTPAIQGTDATAAQVDSQSILDQAGIDITPPTIDPTLTTAVDEVQAITGEVQDLATVKGQLESLYADVESGTVPQWAVGAYNAAQGAMAARGMGASTIAAGAITTAYMQSALPIASQDASTFFQMDMTNLNNRQQAALENVRMSQQNMLTDVAIQNATAQFNAENQTQVQQFVASLISSMSSQNAQMVTNVSTFNAAESNRISAQQAGNEIATQQFNKQMEAQISEFNSQLEHTRDVWNSEMSFAVEQSNVLWRRAVNTENTAQINAANSANVQNLLNMSATAQNNIWQQWRDEAAWSYASAERAVDRDFNLVMAANNREFATEQGRTDWIDAAGRFALDLVSS